MKKILVMLLSLASITTFSQSADEVVLKYNTAMGGLENFNKIKTAKFTGVLTSQSNKLPFTTQIVNGKSMRTDVQVNGQSVVNVFDNGVAWKINPFAGAPTATNATDAELISFRLQASLLNNLMDYKARGHKVELLGQEDVNGMKAYKIALTSKDDNKITTYFIDATEYLLVKSISKREIAGTEYDAESFYSDFKTVEGLKFCSSFVQKIQGKQFQDVKYATIELNIPVDNKIFAKPK